MSKVIKDEYLQIRISSTEKEEIKADAKKQGFDDTSAFILWLYRHYGKK
jgi:hypothetical protein